MNNLGALPEVVEDSGGGLIYENPDELRLAIEKLGSNRKLRDELGTNGHAAFLQYWNEKAHLERYLELVDELMEKRSPKSQIRVLRKGVSATANLA